MAKDYRPVLIAVVTKNLYKLGVLDLVNTYLLGWFSQLNLLEEIRIICIVNTYSKGRVITA